MLPWWVPPAEEDTGGEIVRIPEALTIAAVVAVVATGCSADSEPEATSTPTSESSSPTPSGSESKSTQPTPAESSSGPELVITINGDQVSPNAEEISLDVGEPLTIRFTTDRGGELHVHSKPEQFVEFPAGKSTKELVIETPGSVEIEEHDTSVVVAQAQVGG